MDCGIMGFLKNEIDIRTPKKLLEQWETILIPMRSLRGIPMPSEGIIKGVDAAVEGILSTEGVTIMQQ